MRLSDTRAGYGWVSIFLHWTTAFVVVALWFIGSSISNPRAGNTDEIVRTHTTLALLAYVLLWARVIWRFRKGHPGPGPRQKGGAFYAIGKGVHMLLITAIAGMLLTGPLTAWSGGVPLRLFDLEIPSPIPLSPSLFQICLATHRTLGLIIITLTCLHIAGVLKHIAFNRDGTFDKMMLPEPAPGEQPAPPPA